LLDVWFITAGPSPLRYTGQVRRVRNVRYGSQRITNSRYLGGAPHLHSSAGGSSGSPPPAGAIQIDLGTALQGAVAVADFFVKRSAARRVAQRELEQTCLQLAQEYQGLLGVPDLLMRAQCDRKQAECCLQQLERASLCRYLCDYQQEALYVFPGFLPRQWECDYCQSRLPVPQGTPASSMCQCAGCGANMTQKIID
jgi:hypothetical protein